MEDFDPRLTEQDITQHEDLVAGGEGGVLREGKHPEESIAEMVNRFIREFTSVGKK